jgi:hypothetical protein
VNRSTAILAISIAICTMGADGARGDDVSVNASLNSAVVPVGDEVLLTVSIRGKFRRSADPEFPPMEDFDVYDSGTSQNFSFINGQIESSISFRYTLVPKKEGVYEIGPIRFTIGDKEYASEKLKIEVVPASNVVAPQGVTRTPSGGDEPAGEEEAQKDRSIFIQAEVGQDTVYVNQQITWTLSYYSDGRVSLLRSPNYTPPEAEGFWVEDLPPQNKYYTTLNNRQYLVNEIKRGYFPTSPGAFEIGPAKVDVVVDDLTNNRYDDFFSRSFRNGGMGRSQTLSTKAWNITVLPLPLGRQPKGFGGVVAENLKLSMAADKQVVMVGEPINLTVELNGRGNMKTVAPPRLEGMESFKVYESGSHSDVFKKGYVVTGRKKYSYVVIPKFKGQHTIPAVNMTYFDPVKKKYLVTQSHPVHLDVQPGAKEEGRKIIYAGAGDEFEVISQDIRFIHPVPAVLSVSSGVFPNGRTLLALHALPLFAVIFSLAVERRRRRFRENISLARSSRALRDAEKKIGAARKMLQSGKIEDGFAGVSGALSGYFSDKMNAASAGLTAEAVETFLEGKGVDDDTVATVKRIIGACDAARFAAGPSSADDGVEIAAAASDVLRAIEKRYLR